MKNKSAAEKTDLQQLDADRGASPFDAAFACDQSFPAPELARRLDADMERVFYGSPAATGVEPQPAQAESQAPAACVEVCQLLNQCLTNCIDVRLQCKQAQWDMDGANINELTQLFAQTAAAIEHYADRLAARITALGGFADGRLESVVEYSGLNSYPGPVVRDFRHIDAVASALAVTAVSLRSDFAAMDERCDKQTGELLQELALGLESYCARLQA